MNHPRRRRMLASLVIVLLGAALVYVSPDSYQATQQPVNDAPDGAEMLDASQALDAIEKKGRAPKTGYDRANFGPGWARIDSCDMRNLILARDLVDVVRDDQCRVLSGILNDPYTANQISFIRGPESSQRVQIDHVVSLSDAWQKGAQQLTQQRRIDLSNDPLNLLAVDGPANQHKADSDAASWLPPNRSFRCQFVARQISVKYKYGLWVTAAEQVAMARVLDSCPDQPLPVASYTKS